jgi:hypothetical protein
MSDPPPLHATLTGVSCHRRSSRVDHRASDGAASESSVAEPAGVERDSPLKRGPPSAAANTQQARLELRGQQGAANTRSLQCRLSCTVECMCGAKLWNTFKLLIGEPAANLPDPLHCWCYANLHQPPPPTLTRRSSSHSCEGGRARREKDGSEDAEEHEDAAHNDDVHPQQARVNLVTYANFAPVASASTDAAVVITLM